MKDVATLFTGTTLAQLLPLLAAPLLSRLYTPAQFGELGLMVAALAIFNNVSSLQYAAAIMLPTEDDDALSLVVLSGAIVLGFSLLAAGLLLLFGDALSRTFEIRELATWRMALPALVLAAGIYNTLIIWEGRKKRFDKIATAQVAQSGVQVTAKLSMGWLGLLGTGLIWGTVVGQLTATVLFLRNLRRDLAGLRVTRLWARVRKSAVEFVEFPRYTLWQGLFGVLSLHGVVFVLGAFYGVAVVGFYSFAMSILAKPTRLIGSAVAQVFYQHATEQDAAGASIAPLTRKSIAYLGLMGLVIYVPLLFASRPLFIVAFGPAWGDAGTISQIMAPVFFSGLVSAPFQRVAIVRRRQRDFLLLTIGLNVILPTAVLLSGVFERPYTEGLMWASGLILLYTIFSTRWILSLSAGPPRSSMPAPAGRDRMDLEPPTDP